MAAVVSIGIWIVTAFLTILLFFVESFLTIILFPFDKKRKVNHRQCFWWSSAVIGFNPYWRLQVSGLENIDPHKTYVVVSNHQSLADIIVMYQTRMQFKWVAKESLFQIPFIGWCLFLTKHIKLSRGKFASIKQSYRKAAYWLKNDISVVFFPEGTRSATGKIGEFQNGAFKLAIQEQKPILPIAISGTRDAIPKGSWFFKTKVKGKLTILPPVETTEFQPGDFISLKDTVHGRLASLIT
ncbi:MAG: 1-acyl-sn-glycerol-3-phosphate acyltransferase [Candidatus Omnitrophica bacterium]|nr:1-acyl-sn-glycerol-3-phosphate acyltransferase [Candidatus Omnitrophota bacterium]